MTHSPEEFVSKKKSAKLWRRKKSREKVLLQFRSFVVETTSFTVQQVKFFVRSVWSATGLPDFSWYMIPKLEKMYEMNTKHNK
jgi:hypothetical protein